MKKAAVFAIAAGLVTSPVHGADWSDVRTGTFVGARVQLPFGGRQAARPRASLSFAPTLSRVSGSGVVSTSIGEGVSFNLSPRSRPTLTLAGVRADRVLRLHRNGDVNGDMKLGVSTGGWVAIGVGVAALAGGIYFIHLVKEAEESSD